MNIWLQGPSGAGKTTVGRVLAERRGIEFVDVDEQIERMAGKPIVEIFRDEGEHAFRRLERDLILQLSSESSDFRVVAVGGGAVQDKEIRNSMSITGVRVFLDVSPDAAVSRLEAASTRPLLSGEDLRTAWQKLYDARSAFYRDAELIIETAAAPDEIAEHVDTKLVDLEAESWSIEAHPGGERTVVRAFESVYVLMQHLKEFVGEREHAIITDSNVTRYFHELIFPRGQRGGFVTTVESGERFKTLSSVESMGAELARHGFSRDGVIVGIGGGTVTDLAGFLGATYMRGVPAVYVPTTLLAQVDAAIGGKTAVNAGGVRNLIGVFKQPAEVLICPVFLRSLPPRELRSGLVESLKMGAIHSQELFDQSVRATEQVIAARVPDNISEVVRLSIETKLRIVEADAHDRALRISLNFGHTFAHALEAVEPGVYAHGEAVAIGMIAATILANRLEVTAPDRCQSITSKVLPLTYYAGGFHDVNSLIEAMKADKKREGTTLRFVLPADDGFQVLPLDDMELVAQVWQRAFELIGEYDAGTRGAVLSGEGNSGEDAA
jgi:3-dehydroquinate synthase/shikimate kinase/3-dehydroquinate synthase